MKTRRIRGARIEKEDEADKEGKQKGNEDKRKLGL
jgi:hypothetical protein